jgi:hypothetical protein
MTFNEQQCEILFRAWTLAQAGNGQVLVDEAIPDAAELAEQGWLERRVEENGDVSWWWTPAADQALSYGALFNAATGSVN